MEKVIVQNKIKLLFEKLTQPNYVMNNYYTEILINKLAPINDPETSYLGTIPLISDLIIEVWDKTIYAHLSVKIFLIKILAIGSRKEMHFVKIFSVKGDEIFKSFSEINAPDMNCSLAVAYMDIALGAVEHASGIDWLLKSGAWKIVISSALEVTGKTVFLTRQNYKFISKFLWKLNDMGDETNIKQVFNSILHKLTLFDLINAVSMTREQEEEISKSLEPMLNILLSILSEVDYIQEKNLIFEILNKEYSIQIHIGIMIDRMRKEDIILMLTKITYWYEFAKLFQNKPISAGEPYKPSDFLELSAVFFNTINMAVQRRSATLAIDFSNSCKVIWTTVWGKNPSIMLYNGINVSHQLITICLMPCLLYVTKNKVIGKNTDNGLDDYLYKIMDSVCEHTARAAYSLRDLLMELDISVITLQSVKRLTCLKNYLNDEQANLIFQALFYILQEYDPTHTEGDPKTNLETYDDDEAKVNVMTYVLDAVLLLIKNYNINWQESLEVISLYTVVNNILKRPNLTCKFVVTALNVIAVTIKKFLTPNLSLLMESKPGSAMHELGNLIYRKMHDLLWEIRDSALELLLACTEISYIKFPPFQKQIMENNLIKIAATIALNDHEFYVQASALKCLGAATRVNIIWEQLKSQYPHIQEQLLSILNNNQEGIVRKEACNVLCEIYRNLRLTSTFKQNLYEHMVSSALGDFHWEVQINALKFWRVVINSLLKDQGMLDGTFPPVTFSKESRKIVTLNETEIQKRLLKVLDELANIGCLTVFVKLLYIDTDVDIMDLALSISSELLEILNNYKVPVILIPKENEPSTVEEVLCYIKDESLDCEIKDLSGARTLIQSDNVIEDILNANDINLLAKMYEGHLNIENNEILTSKPSIKLLKTVSPYLFVQFLRSKNFKTVVEEKKKWKEGIRSLPSLFDDVLGIYEINNDVNSLDCY